MIKSTRMNPALIVACGGGVLLGGTHAALAQTPVPFFEPFADNSIVLSRVGGADQATGNISPSGFAVALDEFRITSGAGAFATLSYAQTLYLPSAGADRHVNIGNSKAELQLTRTTVGGDHSLFLAGYDASPGANGLANTNPNTTARVVTSVNQNGVIDSTTRIADGFGAPPTSAASLDGTNIFYAGDGSSGRIRQTTLGATGGSDVGSLSQINMINFHNGQLYATGSTSNNTVYSIDTGTGTATALPGLNAVSAGQFYDFFFAGDDTLYLAHDGTGSGVIGGLYRYDFDGSTWNFAYAIEMEASGTADGLIGLWGSYDAQSGRVDFYATGSELRDTRLFGITDNLSNTLGTQADVALLYINPFSDVAGGRSSAWRGVEHFPGVIPAPGASALLALGGVLAARRRRN